MIYLEYKYNMFNQFYKLSLCILSLFIFLNFAYSKNSTDNISNSSTVNNTDEQNSLLILQKQIKQMRDELQELESHQNQPKASSNQKSAFNTYNSKVNSIGIGGSSSTINEDEALNIENNVNTESSIISLDNNLDKNTGGVNVGNSPSITTGGKATFLGAYSGNNTIPLGQIPDNLFASTLIGQRANFDDYSVFFGGFIEADAQSFFGSKNINDIQGNTLASTGQNIYLTSANLYFLASLGHYVTAQFDFDADQGGNFGLGNAFVIFGNLDTSPFFVTAGKSYLSVGAYGGGGTLTSGITQNIFEPGQVTNVSINYKNDALNANIAVSGATDSTANFSTGVFYADNWTDDLAIGFNTGYIYDIAHSADTPSFQIFLDNNNRSDDIIGEFNIDANITYNILEGVLNLGSGWATTTNKQDFNGNGDNVLANAWYVAVNYSLELGGNDTNFGVSYGQTYNASQVPMALASSPINFDLATSGIQNQLIFSAQRAYFDDNVLFGPEYVYQRLYDGQHMNTITIDMSVYI
jgi:hypothetical protein